MIVHNASRGTVLGEAIEAASTATKRVRGLLGRDRRGPGPALQALLLLHTFFMQFPIDIVFVDRRGKVLKSAQGGVTPFKLVLAPLRAHYALELPVGAIDGSKTRAGDHLRLVEDEEQLCA